jgi:hypothetical protein
VVVLPEIPEPADRERIDEAARITNRESIVMTNVNVRITIKEKGQEYRAEET